jgi:hypothetical protein
MSLAIYRGKDLESRIVNWQPPYAHPQVVSSGVRVSKPVFNTLSIPVGQNLNPPSRSTPPSSNGARGSRCPASEFYGGDQG